MKFLKNFIITISAIALGFSLMSTTSVAKKGRIDSIKCTSGSTYKLKSGAIEIAIDYSAKRSRELVVALYDSKGGWVSATKLNISKGKKSISVKLNGTEKGGKIKIGKGYSLRYHTRPTGTTWKESVAKGEIKNVMITRH